MGRAESDTVRGNARRLGMTVPRQRVRSEPLLLSCQRHLVRGEADNASERSFIAWQFLGEMPRQLAYD
jgi:hypothetical protein